MNILRRGMCSIIRKPIKSLLLLLVVVVISSFFIAGLASQSASVNVQDSTRQQRKDFAELLQFGIFRQIKEYSSKRSWKKKAVTL